MNASQLLDLPATKSGFLHPISPHAITFLHRDQTEEELIRKLAHAIYQPLPSGVRINLLTSEVVFAITFTITAILMAKKRSLGGLWILTRRRSSFGTVYIANAVFALVLAIVSYLFAYQGILVAAVICLYSRASTLEWFWIVPLPFYPLVVGAWTSIHGFVVGCSPRSPHSSNYASRARGGHRQWYYLPVPSNPRLINWLLILPSVLFTLAVFLFVGLQGTQYYAAKRLARQLLPADVHAQLKEAASNPHGFFHGTPRPASDELIWNARLVMAAYFECYRYISLHMAVFAAYAMAVWMPYLFYGIPNLFSLLHHACTLSPVPVPETCTSYLPRLWFWLTVGRPKAGQSSLSMVNTWKMTALAHIYVYLVCLCVPGYGALPMYMMVGIYRKLMPTGDGVTEIRNLVYASGIVSILSSTLFAGFWTLATIDPIFRAAIGLNVKTPTPLNTEIEIQVTVQHHQTRVDDYADPFASEKIEQRITLQQLLETESRNIHSARSILTKSSVGSLVSPKPSPTSHKFPSSASTNTLHVSHDDLNLPAHPHSKSLQH